MPLSSFDQAFVSVNTMPIEAEKYELPQGLCFTNSQEQGCCIEVVEFQLTAKQEGSLSVCRLRGQCGDAVYQQALALGWFQFSADLRDLTPTIDLLPDRDVEVVLLLRPDLLPLLQEQGTTAETVASYLSQLSQAEPIHPLLSTESWLLLSVSQEQPQGRVGFRTLWDYLNWEQIAQVEDPEDLEEDLMQAVVHYFQDTAASQLGIDPEDEVGQQVVTATTDLIDQLLVQLPAQEQSPEATSQQVIDVMTQFLRSVLPGARSPVPSPSEATEVSSRWCDRLQQFFDQEHWTFDRRADQPVLHLLFKGGNGQWDCYAQVRDNPYPLLLFYSILPLKVPKKKRRSLAEFLSRANYGLLLGNFELDFADGEIRYKTSLTLSGSDPDSSALQQWVYGNVLTADRYLPGILQVLEGSSPETAIGQLESHDP